MRAGLLTLLLALAALGACKPAYRPHPLQLSASYLDGGPAAAPAGRPQVIVLWLPG